MFTVWNLVIYMAKKQLSSNFKFTSVQILEADS